MVYKYLVWNASFAGHWDWRRIDSAWSAIPYVWTDDHDDAVVEAGRLTAMRGAESVVIFERQPGPVLVPRYYFGLLPIRVGGQVRLAECWVDDQILAALRFLDQYQPGVMALPLED